MKVWTSLVATALLAAAMPAVQAADSYDGTWQGDYAESTGRRLCGRGEIRFEVEGDRLHGQLASAARNFFPIHGTVDADGNFRSDSGKMTGKFTGASATFTWRIRDCVFAATATRSTGREEVK
jgi:hypothetical protein